MVIEWGECFSPPERDVNAADIRISNQILDDTERAIGLRPEQYILSIGAGRFWDSMLEAWRSRADVASELSPLPDSLPVTQN